MNDSYHCNIETYTSHENQNVVPNIEQNPLESTTSIESNEQINFGNFNYNNQIYILELIANTELDQLQNTSP